MGEALVEVGQGNGGLVDVEHGEFVHAKIVTKKLRKLLQHKQKKSNKATQNKTKAASSA